MDGARNYARLYNPKLNNSFFQIPDEVFDIYTWKNGIMIDYIESKNLTELSLFPFGIFLPFELSFSEYLSFTLGYWNKNFFPLFEAVVAILILFPVIKIHQQIV